MSSYEAGRAYNTNGESLYEIVHITHQDQTLVEEFARQASELIAKVLRHLVTDVRIVAPIAPASEEGEGRAMQAGIVIECDNDASIQYHTTFESDLKSIISSYVMWKWLESRLPERGKAWQQIYETAMSAIKRGVKRKKPTLSL